MKLMLRRLELGTELLSYIREQLKQGNRLSRCVLDGLRLEGGTVYTTLPTTVSKGDVLNFRVGGVAKRADTEPALVELIREYLRIPGRLALFEDKLASPADPFLNASATDFVVCESQVYYLLTSAHTQDEIRRTIRFAQSYMFVGALSAVPIGFSEPRTRTDLGLSFLNAVAQTLDHLVIGAYDGEGELIWNQDARD